MQLSSSPGTELRILLKEAIMSSITNSFFSLMVNLPSSSSLPNSHWLARFAMEMSFLWNCLRSASTSTLLSSLPSSSDLIRRCDCMKSRAVLLITASSSSSEFMRAERTSDPRWGKLFSFRLVSSMPSLILWIPTLTIRGTALRGIYSSSFSMSCEKGTWLM